MDKRGSSVAPSIGDLDISYLTDNVLLLRYYEHNGEVRQSISVFKRRGGPHERTIRDLRLGSSGIEVGRQLHDFRGVLSGEPTYTDREARLVGMKETEISLDNEPMRVFVLAPAGRDATVTAGVLSAGRIFLLKFVLRLVHSVCGLKTARARQSSPRRLWVPPRSISWYDA